MPGSCLEKERRLSLLAVGSAQSCASEPEPPRGAAVTYILLECAALSPSISLLTQQPIMHLVMGCQHGFDMAPVRQVSQCGHVAAK